MLIVLVWWLWMQVIGLAALPLAFHFFRHLPDRGYTFARPLGLLLTCYGLWLGSSLGVLRNSAGGALFSLLVVAAVALIVYRRARRGPAAGPGLGAWVRAHWRLIVVVELLYAGMFGLWALLRAYSPELTVAGGEKFMEIMYLNSIGRSEYFPPHDAWLSGYGISYYYFGYVMIATLTRLSGYPAHLTFHVGLALLFALTCTGAFGLVYNLVHGLQRREGADKAAAGGAGLIGWGLLGTALVAIVGNLEGFLEVLYSARLLGEGFWRWLDILEINQPFDPTAAASLMPGRSGWWWWRASRVIHELDPTGQTMGIQPIDEFPGFSFLLGDMHPHVLALPFVLLALAIALRTLLAEQEDGPAWPVSEGGEGAAGAVEPAWLRPIRQLSPLVPLCLGGLAFLNTWDFPIAWLLFVGAYGLGRWSQTRRFGWPFLRDVGLTGGVAAVLGFLFYLPFYIGFQSQAGGLLPTLYVGTRFRHYFVMFGPFLVALAGLLAGLALKARRSAPGARLLRSWVGWAAAFLLLPLGIMILIALLMLVAPQGREFLEGIRQLPFIYEIVGDRPWLAVLGQLLLVKLRTWVMPVVVAAMAAMAAALLQRSAAADPAQGAGELSHPSLRFVLLCAAAGLLLTLSVEFVYLVDNFQVRMNTIFKFYFQAWVLMAIAGAVAVYWLSRQESRWRWGVLAGFWLLFGMGMVYPILGNISRAGGLGHPPTLDGTAYLAADPERGQDLAAVTWLNENVEGAPVILEAPGSGGSSYVYEGRISALTGLPTLLGWAGHEGQWRGSYDVQSARDPEIMTLYNTLDVQAAGHLLEEYGVTYVYVGPLERAKYDARGLAKFEQFMDVVYEEERVTIYRVRR